MFLHNLNKYFKNKVVSLWVLSQKETNMKRMYWEKINTFDGWLHALSNKNCFSKDLKKYLLLDVNKDDNTWLQRKMIKN